ncbi:hypothetical protein F5Y05DRAFT_353498 [Hypoxylon sp. FL0543]|nr:hypothetical protein F5Y05DRAFT_353498 [Hypoxylon sp. FL0543]
MHTFKYPEIHWCTTTERETDLGSWVPIYLEPYLRHVTPWTPTVGTYGAREPVLDDDPCISSLNSPLAGAETHNSRYGSSSTITYLRARIKSGIVRLCWDRVEIGEVGKMMCRLADEPKELCSTECQKTINQKDSVRTSQVPPVMSQPTQSQDPPTDTSLRDALSSMMSRVRDGLRRAPKHGGRREGALLIYHSTGKPDRRVGDSDGERERERERERETSG